MGACLTVFVGYSHQAFMVSFFLRNHGESLADMATGLGFPGPTALVGLSLGLVLGLGGAIGSLLGGQIGDMWRSPKALAYVPAIGSLLAAPFYVAAFLMPHTLTALFLLLIPTILKSLWYGPVYASIQGVSHPRSRATATAIFLFLLNAIGLGMGPLSVGLISDAFATTMGPAEGLRWSLIFISAISAVSAICFWIAAPSLEKEMIEE